MPLFARSEFWTDVYTAGGFWIGLVSLVVAVVGFGYTIYQVRKTQSAAAAAKDAAERAYSEGRLHVRSVVAGSALRLATELRQAVVSQDWNIAARRADDLAELFAMLPGSDQGLAETRELLRTWSTTFHRLQSKQISRFPTQKWQGFVLAVQAQIDGLRALFGGQEGATGT